MNHDRRRLYRWLDRHITKIVMAVAIIFLFVKNIDANRERHEFEMKMIEATEKYNEMTKDWSQCYVTQANQIQMRTRCEERMNSLNRYLRECRQNRCN